MFKKQFNLVDVVRFTRVLFCANMFAIPVLRCKRYINPNSNEHLRGEAESICLARLSWRHVLSSEVYVNNSCCEQRFKTKRRILMTSRWLRSLPPLFLALRHVCSLHWATSLFHDVIHISHERYFCGEYHLNWVGYNMCMHFLRAVCNQDGYTSSLLHKMAVIRLIVGYQIFAHLQFSWCAVYTLGMGFNW